MKRMVIALAALVLMGVGGTAIWSHHRSGGTLKPHVPR